MTTLDPFKRQACNGLLRYFLLGVLLAVEKGSGSIAPSHDRSEKGNCQGTHSLVKSSSGYCSSMFRRFFLGIPLAGHSLKSVDQA